MIDAVESWMSAWWGWGPKTDPAFSRLLRLAELEASQRSKARYMARCIAAHELLVSSKPSSNEAMPSGATVAFYRAGGRGCNCTARWQRPEVLRGWCGRNGAQKLPGKEGLAPCWNSSGGSLLLHASSLSWKGTKWKLNIYIQQHLLLLLRRTIQLPIDMPLLFFFIQICSLAETVV